MVSEHQEYNSLSLPIRVSRVEESIERPRPEFFEPIELSARMSVCTRLKGAVMTNPSDVSQVVLMGPEQIIDLFAESHAEMREFLHRFIMWCVEREDWLGFLLLKRGLAKVGKIGEELWLYCQTEGLVREADAEFESVLQHFIALLRRSSTC